MKQYDLSPDSQMTPIIGLLHSTVTYNFARLKRLVKGLTQEDIDYKGQNNEFNSIAQLLRHLAVVDLHWVFRLQSKYIPAELQEAFGKMYDEDGKLPIVKNIPLQKLLTEYEQVQSMFKEVCIKKTDNDLQEVVPFENGNSATVRWGIWHIADHSRHHYANISHLKRLLRKL